MEPRNDINLKTDLNKAFPSMPESFEKRIAATLGALPETAPPPEEKQPRFNRTLRIVASVAAGLMIVFGISVMILWSGNESSNNGSLPPVAEAPAATPAETPAPEADVATAAPEAPSDVPDNMVSESETPSPTEAPPLYEPTPNPVAEATAMYQEEASVAARLQMLYYTRETSGEAIDVSGLIERNKDTEDFFKAYGKLSGNGKPSGEMDGRYSVIWAEEYGEYTDMLVVLRIDVDGKERSSRLKLTFRQTAGGPKIVSYQDMKD